MSTFISLSTILFGFIWATRIKKQQTQVITVLLALAALFQYDNYIGLGRYSIFFISAVSVVAGVEPSNSINLKSFQKTFFLITAIIFILLSLEHMMYLSFDINRDYLAIFYLLMAISLAFHKSRKLKSRLGVIIVWAGIALSWLLA